MSPIVDQVLDEVRGAWRFRWLAMGSAWAVCVLGWLVVLSLPDIYGASARVFVDTKTALRPLLQGLAIESDLDAQLSQVRQAMLGRTQLERVARETDLDLRANTPEERAALLDTLQERISIEQGGDESPGLFIISYEDSSREKSVAVVQKLLDTFVEDTIGGKRQGSEAAQKFLREQIAEYERRLSASEQKLADFKRRNVGLMPAEQGDYFARLQAEMDTVKKLQTALGVALNRREELNRQLRGETPFIGHAGAVAGPNGRIGPGAGAGDTATRIQEIQARLDDLLLRFTEKHPDVVATRETLIQIKERHQEEIAALRRGDAGAAANSGAATNPVYQSIQLNLNGTEVEIAALKGQISDGQRRVKELRELVDTVPEVEAEFSRLNRDYTVTHAQYEALVDRLEKARLSEQAEETGIVRFDIIDPPAAAYAPVAPDRPRLLGLVLLVGLVVGAGLAYLVHQLRPVFNNVRMLHEITGMPVLGAVSMTWLDKRKRESRLRRIAFAGAAAMLMITFVGVMVFQNAGAQLLRHLVV